MIMMMYCSTIIIVMVTAKMVRVIRNGNTVVMIVEQ